ncbi:AAA domain-containing protein [Fusarium sp. LHS14.1]|nr:AAA domain-containing protein [Fusarium sp. LHS14.1]
MEETEVTIVPEGTTQKESTVQSTTQGDQQTAEVASPKSAERSTKNTSSSKHQRKKKTTSGSAKSASNEEEQDTSDGSKADTEPDSDDDANATQAADKSCKKPVGSKKDKDKGQSKKNESGKKLSSSKKNSSKQTSKKSSKQKKKKKAKDDLSDCDTDSSDPSDSDEESDQEVAPGSKKPGLKSQFKALKLQVSQLQQQLSNPAPVPAFSAPGYPLPYQYSHSAVVPQTNTSISQPVGQRSRYGLRESRAAYKTPGTTLKEHLKELGLGGDSSDESDQAAESKKKAKRPAFKRVDQVWDSKIHNYKLQDTADVDSESQYEDFIFHVRRTFDWEGKYRTTYVDIRSKLLRECLQDVIGNTDGVSLVDEVPKLNPHLLFLYLEDLRAHLRALKQAKPAGESKKARKKNQVRLDDKRKHLKVMIKYIDKDYETTKESLYPMLENGLITFDLMWALWKPNTLAYTTTYGCTSEPRVFKVDMATPQSSIVKGRFYYIDGKYVEFDGKRFGYGGMAVDVDEFQGARRITSLPCYPLQYHPNESKLRADLIERGKKFVKLSGVHYKSYQGIAFMKRKKNLVIKFNIQPSRVMIDPSTFRRINPNYSVSSVKPKDPDILSDSSDSESEDCCDCQDSDSDGVEKVKYVTKLFKDGNGEVQRARIPKDLFGSEQDQEELDKIPPKSGEGEDDEEAETFEFTDEEYLIASPVFLGFSFSEKHWLELSVSGIGEIKWNDKAWDSLVLEPQTKDLIKALVKSRKYHAANTIDDVIQGKGKGLVTVLHGPPGTGKTLTAEGISELLKCPLYMASAGELGTDSRYLEAELQKILDTCHAWGAILLLDEADVFLEKRNMHDIQRNALVSIFLRQLEYFQGILFLTTNRVETFDEAFQSRIHIALRYDALDAKAKRTIFQMFLDRVRDLGKLKVEPLKEDDWTYLSKQELNGREIKNVISSAQDLAVNKGEALSMRHIKQVLNVHANFGRDLRGGTGYEDAMRSYF